MSGMIFEGCGNVTIESNDFTGCKVALSINGKHYNPDEQGRLDFTDGVLVHGVECDENGEPLQ